ncbi:MAG: sigma-54 dependent transcriptional regulator [Ignavibacteriales bacterium]|nr:sigma-54 dependent transcriptional regulator [Ignavibacteriales bacterium]
MLTHPEIITQDLLMLDILSRINKISMSDTSVLLVGETGVGKEIFAEYIHNSSSRRDNTLVKISLASLPFELLESELFGHEKGAYTTAFNEKKGLFEIANNGTIFLDDIDDVPLNIQTKLLRVIENKELNRIGGISPIPIDVRLITASKIDLKKLTDEGRFRADLYYRINAVPFFIPPLRERQDDIPFLINHFTKKFVPLKKITFSDQSLLALKTYNYPGNIRELKNIVQRIVLFAENEVNVEDLPNEIFNGNYTNFVVNECEKCYIANSMSYEEVISCVESNLLKKALARAEGNLTKAANLLNLNLSTFRDKIKKHKLH